MNNSVLTNDLAICCMSGGYRGAFIQGVLAAFEEEQIRANAYASCSSSVLIAAYAAFGKVRELDLSVWRDGYAISRIEGNSQSEAMLHSIHTLFPIIKEYLWEQDSRRLFITVSRVKTEEAAFLTQGDGARSLGRRLLIDGLSHKTAWRDEHLELQLFDTFKSVDTQQLTPGNFEDAAYASTRMLHAWQIPATINGLPYVDGSYTSVCPAIQVAGLGYKRIVCILTTHNSKKTDLFSIEDIPDRYGDSSIEFIKPDVDLKELGVDYFSIQDGGLERVFEHGYVKGKDFISTANRSINP